MPSRNKNFIILPRSWSGHGWTNRTGSGGPDNTATRNYSQSKKLKHDCHNCIFQTEM